MSFSLRPFTISGYYTISAITIALYQENGSTVEEMSQFTPEDA